MEPKCRYGVLEVKCSCVAAKIDVLLGVRSLTDQSFE